MIDKSILNIITEKTCTAAKEALGSRLERVILFGSQARGDANEHSDIDIAIVADIAPDAVEKMRREVRNFMGKSALDLEYNVIISLNMVSSSIFKKCATLPFYANLQKEGVELYGI